MRQLSHSRRLGRTEGSRGVPGGHLGVRGGVRGVEAGGEDAGSQGVARRVGRRLSNCDSVLQRNIFLILN